MTLTTPGSITLVSSHLSSLVCQPSNKAIIVKKLFIIKKYCKILKSIEQIFHTWQTLQKKKKTIRLSSFQQYN